MKEYQFIKTERLDNGVIVATLDRPPLNLISPDVLYELKSFFTELNEDDTLRAVVLTGSQRAFCAGADANTFGDVPRYTNIPLGQLCYNVVEDCRLPVIAAIKRIINGFRHDQFSAGLAREVEISPYAYETEDKKEGIAAMREKRPPVFKNK